VSRLLRPVPRSRLSNSRPASPVKIMTAAGHAQVYHKVAGPSPREASAAPIKPEGRPLAPTRETTTTTSETSLVTV
jgi:hypothetical protein